MSKTHKLTHECKSSVEQLEDMQHVVLGNETELLAEENEYVQICIKFNDAETATKAWQLSRENRISCVLAT